MVAQKIKEHWFLVVVATAYLLMALIRPPLAVESVKNSAYYIKEMLIIMPVIFILTALLDLWVPREKIIELLGQEAKAKGVFLAFVIGSISAGPIYAAFPMCVMLRNKGASIRNVVIILSSWAVIKVPMLLNEAKFLGPRFMVIRWILTVLAILIFSALSDKIIADDDLPQQRTAALGLSVNPQACMGCTMCAASYPELFAMEKNKAVVQAHDDAQIDRGRLRQAMEACPVQAIQYFEG